MYWGLSFISFNLTEHGKSNNVSIALPNYEYIISASFSLVEPMRQAKTILTIKICEKRDQNFKAEIAELVMSNTFAVINYDEIIRKDQSTGNTIMPNSLIEICNNLAVSSARGMLTLKLENTIYSNAILPLFDPKTLAPSAPTP